MYGMPLQGVSARPKRDGSPLSVRWAVDASSWRPSPAEWRHTLASADPVEQKRISRFVFFEDAKSSLLGRLLMRQLVSTALRVPWEGIEAGARPKRQAVPR